MEIGNSYGDSDSMIWPSFVQRRSMTLRFCFSLYLTNEALQTLSFEYVSDAFIAAHMGPSLENEDLTKSLCYSEAQQYGSFVMARKSAEGTTIVTAPL